MACSSSNEPASFFDYYHSLDKQSKSCYIEKVAKLGGLKDPYLITREQLVLHGKTGHTWGIPISIATSFILPTNTLETV